MKKIFTIFAILGVLAGATSCKEDFLKQDKPLSMTESVIFADADYTESNLLGCYSVFKSTRPTFMGGLGYIVFDNRGDDIINVSNPVTMQHTYEMFVLGTEDENNSIWNYAYYTINFCNIFLDNLDKYNSKAVLGEEKYAQFAAEAKFLRAYSYYVLANLYSQPYCIDPEAKAVPLRLTGLISSGNNDCPRSTIKKVYEQILDDCLPDALPSDSDVAGKADAVTRASAAAAHLLRMRVYMAMKEWDKAIAEGNAIKNFELADDVSKLYGTAFNDNKELIFVLPMSDQDKPNTQMSAAEYFSASATVAWLDTESGVMSQTGYFLDKDQRINKLVSEKDGKGRYFSKKFNDYGGHLDWLPLMRFAEVKLNLAECYANKSDGTANAKTCLADVRSRSIAAADDVMDVNSLSGGNLKTAIYNERRLEFICEGIRGIDIMRRGESFVKKNSYVDLNIAPSDGNYVWPIPDNEKTFNKAL